MTAIHIPFGVGNLSITNLAIDDSSVRGTDAPAWPILAPGERWMDGVTLRPHQGFTAKFTPRNLLPTSRLTQPQGERVTR